MTPEAAHQLSRTADRLVSQLRECAKLADECRWDAVSRILVVRAVWRLKKRK